MYDADIDLLELRASHSDICVSSTNMEWKVAQTDADNGRYVSLKSITGKGVVAVGNFTDQPINCTVNFQSTGTWYNYLSTEETLTVTSQTQAVTVPAHGYRVYTTFR